MRKLLLQLALFALGIASVSAQTPLRAARRSAAATAVRQSMGAMHSARALKRAPIPTNGSITPKDNQTWWGYFNPADSASGVGIQQAAVYDACIYVPANGTIASGKTIKAVRVWLEKTKLMDNFKVWASTSLPKNSGSSDADILFQSVDKKTLVDAKPATSGKAQGQPTDIELSKPLTVGDKGLYIGITFETSEDITDQEYPLLSSTYAKYWLDNSFFLRANGEDQRASITNWLDCAANGLSPLAMQLLVEGDIPYNCVSITKQLREQTLKSGESRKFPVYLVNQGKNAISSLELECYVDGVKYGNSQIINLNHTLDNSGVTTIDSIQLTGFDNNGLNNYVVKVAKVNGQDNGVADSMKQCSVNVVSLNTTAPRRVVFESLDFNSYGNAMLNIVTGDLLKKAHGDSVIVIHGHYMDPLAFDCWEEATSINSLPGAMFDRGQWTRNVYFGNQAKGYGMEEFYQKALQVPSEATIEMDSLKLTKNGKIVVNTRSTFLISRNDDAYGIVYALLDDGLKATLKNSLSRQSSTYGPDENLTTWFNKSSSIANYAFNDIPVQANDNPKLGKLLSDVKAGEVKKQSYIFNINGNTNIKELKKLKVVAMIVNRNNYHVVNAVELPVSIPSDFPEFAVSVSDFPNQFTLVDKKGTIPVTVSNSGLKNVTSIAYTLDDGQETSKSIQLSGFAASKSFTIEVPAETEAKPVPHKITITKVNGKANGTTNNVANGNVYYLTKQLPRKTVVEEFTGSWCGWCPRGTVAVTELNKTMSDSCVAFAVHSSDPMAITSYQGLVPSGLPGAKVNRETECDPYFGSEGGDFGMLTDVRKACAKIIEGMVTIDKSEEKDGLVTMSGNTEFAFTGDKNNYALAFVLLCDSLTGESSSWYQTNYFSGSNSYSSYPMLLPLTKKENTYKEPFNHVAIQTSDVVNGEDNTVPAKIEADKKNAFTYTFDIKNNTLAQHYDKLKVVALLIDRSTGKIVNANEAKVFSNTYATGINSVGVSKERKPVAVYTMDGQKIETVRHGINIIKYSDGSVSKVFVK